MTLTKTKIKNPAPKRKKEPPNAAADALPHAAKALRRGRKTQRTRRHLAEAAVRLFEEKGFAATTVDEIVDAADYSTSTFFRLFADKEDVVFYDFAEHLDDLKAVFASPDHGNAWVTIREAFIEYARLWDSDEAELGCRRARLFHTEPILHARYLTKNSEWEGVIAKLVSAELKGVPDQELLCQVIAGAAVAAFRAAWRTQLAARGLSLADCVHDAFNQLESLGLFFRTPAKALAPSSSAKQKTARR